MSECGNSKANRISLSTSGRLTAEAPSTLSGLHGSIGGQDDKFLDLRNGGPQCRKKSANHMILSTQPV
jgi:hypothetical protein